MKRLIAATAAAGVLVAGAFVASTVTTSPAEAQSAGEPPIESPERQQRPEPGTIINDVIDGLVADGTIDAGQADAIKDAFEAKRDEIIEEFGRPGHRERGFKQGALRGLMADGVITQAEVDALPEDHPLRTGDSPLSELLEDDGQITQDELEAFRQENRPSGPREDSSTG